MQEYKGTKDILKELSSTLNQKTSKSMGICKFYIKMFSVTVNSSLSQPRLTLGDALVYLVQTRWVRRAIPVLKTLSSLVEESRCVNRKADIQRSL